MNGMDARTGKPLAGVEHLRQSIADILSTPIGSRIARREYGSLLPDLVDQPMNGAGVLKLYAATALALLRWEPRLRLTRVTLERTGTASFALQIEGRRTDLPRPSTARVSIPLTA